jgi:hypothetical protein
MPKKPSANGANRSEQARVKRAEAAIGEILKREGVVLTSNRVRVLFANQEGKYRGGSTVDVKDLAELLGRPNMLIMPQVQLEPSKQPQPR